MKESIFTSNVYKFVTTDLTYLKRKSRLAGNFKSVCYYVDIAGTCLRMIILYKETNGVF